MDIGVPALRAEEPRAIAKHVNALVTRLKSALAPVRPMNIVDVITGPTGHAFPAQHGLGVVPVTFFACKAAQFVDVWATPTDRLAWTDTTVYLRCNVASANVQVILFA